jgi:hypothetical protein
MMDVLAQLESSAFGAWLRESGSLWAYPAVLTLHTIGLAVLVGANAVLDLRLLGAAPRIPLAPLERLFPVMWAGFWINFASGVALFVADATTKGTTALFLSKLAIVAAGVIVLRRIRATVYGRGPAVASPTSSLLAGVSLALWLLAIVTGRYMAYL